MRMASYSYFSYYLLHFIRIYYPSTCLPMYRTAHSASATSGDFEMSFWFILCWSFPAYWASASPRRAGDFCRCDSGPSISTSQILQLKIRRVPLGEWSFCVPEPFFFFFSYLVFCHHTWLEPLGFYLNQPPSGRHFCVWHVQTDNLESSLA